MPGEVLVKVKATSINLVDVYVRKDRNALQAFMHPKEGEDRFILGWDMAGIIEDTGTNVKEFKKGIKYLD